MLRFFTMLALFLLACVLTACGARYETHYTYAPPASKMGKMCAAQCQQGRGACENICELRNAKCLTAMRHAARDQYDAYQKAEREKGLAVKKTVNDFNHSDSCKLSCHCNVSFNTCYSACGGQVFAKQVCIANCNP